MTKKRKALRIVDRPARKSTVLKKRLFLEALTKTLGVVAPALREVGIVRMTLSRWLNTDSDFKALYDEMDDLVLDFAESHLHQQIKAGIPASTIFFLKTKGKKRGYIERTELIPLVSSRFEDLTDEELEKKLKQDNGSKSAANGN